MTPRAPAMSPHDRRAAIIEATVPLLREHGAGLTTKQVADAAGIAEGTVFRAFGTKDELIKSCATAVFDTTTLVAELRGVAAEHSLDARLTAAVAALQRYLERAIGLMSTLAASGALPHPPPRTGPPGPRAMRDPAVDAALVDLVGPDAEHLRYPAQEVVTILSHLTLASSHPMLSGRAMPAEEIVSVVLDGVRKARPC
ncbi:TetR/AcrR family transcriptional regulator [Phycicoccus endophyticus]|uniref:TetR/AcrR family transcriptional regulator n=1 Tax=Phycicoccus endophyticus TaxID=1690220 RepID=A0A7G9QZT3_9MICO|nr:TetR/AcrR family transcriptional regulator [Phycicoccus endophyticus]NHI20056.1 TetR/AcrR family transcriptional regulator [Phycicoccus endophyticus]QNN48858.1 TetR/AcrR family transcriptional regulator [Phycicoccus endophyticus]